LGKKKRDNLTINKYYQQLKITGSLQLTDHVCLLIEKKMYRNKKRLIGKNCYFDKKKEKIPEYVKRKCYRRSLFFAKKDL
jgi:hypothetical protein